MAEETKKNFDGKPDRSQAALKKDAPAFANRVNPLSKSADEWDDRGDSDFAWSAVANRKAEVNSSSLGIDNFMSNRIEFSGKNLENGKFANENFENANFSVANLKGVDFSGANLKGVDFSGADLSDANLAGANLSGAILANSVLKHTNFTGAIMNGVVLTDADLDNAILLDIKIDAIGLEDLQELIEYLAKFAPHKLNLAKINLTMLNLAKIDLKNVNLRGVDFTGCDFTGVNIMELDLSECIITPQQIAQAMGRVPNAEELRKLMAPKIKPKGPNSQGIDLTDLFFDNGREAGVWETSKDKGISTKKIVDMIRAGHKVYRRVVKRPEGNKAEEAAKRLEDRKEAQATSDDLRKVLEDNKRALIEKRKQEELEARRNKKMELEQALNKDNEPEKAHETQEKPKVKPLAAERINAFRDRSRD